MKQTLTLLLTIFILNGCGQKVKPLPCKPVPCTKIESSHVKIPTFKKPVSRKFKAVKDLGDGTAVFKVEDVFELVSNINRYEWIYEKQTAIAVQLNKRGE